MNTVRMSRCGWRLRCAPLLLLLCIHLVDSQIVVAQEERHTQAMLVEITLQTSTLAPEAMTGAIEKALASADPKLRELALGAVASRVGGPRFSADPNVRTNWSKDREWVQQLRPAVIQALQDSDRGVRAQAVLALGNYDFELGKPHQFRPETVRTFTDHYYVERDLRIRTEILKAFALGGTASVAIDKVVVDAMRDEAPAVRQYAVVAARKLDASRASEPLVRALQDPDKSVRATVASSLGAFGRNVARAAPAVEDAMLREADPEVRTALKDALTAIRDTKAR